MNANITVTAKFDIKTYTITASAMSNGDISPQGSTLVNHGSNQSFTIVPKSGYRVLDVKIDGISQGASSSYTFANATANHNIEAYFSMVNDGTVKIFLEAEGARYLRTPMQISRDNTASFGYYIWVPEGKGNADEPFQSGGSAVYIFNAPMAGQYVIWGRVFSTDINSNSFFVSMDYGNYNIWETKTGNSWVWDSVNNSNEAGPVLFPLTAGRHTLTIKQSENGVKLDKILITNDLNYIP